MSRKMLINVLHPEEARVAIVQDGRLMELNIEISGKEQTKGNIYKGVVVRVEPGLQAAFVDIGHKKPGFIQMGDLHPASWQWRDDLPEGDRKRRPRIQDVLRRGQELIVQVEKDARDMKGAALTSYLSLPGRYMVLMPGDDAAGISRKIEDNATRKELKALVAELQVPAGYGYIVRTEAVGRSGEELKKDLDYLIGVHERILQQAATIKGAGEIYQDAGVIIRTIRDYFSDDIDEVLVDDKAACQQAIDFFKEIMPGCERLVKLHKEKRPIFSKYQLEEQIDQLYEKRVPLPSGGSLIIEPTEALVSIDVNSGKSSGEKGVEDTAFKTNLEAAAEVARHLRLRDLGGLVVIDFIDMRDNKHNKEVERALKDALKMDKARVNLGRISQFGMMEMSRQRIAKNINDAIHLECPHCEGRGRVKSVEAMAVSFLRKVHAAAAKGQIAEVRGGLPLEVAYFLLNRKKRELAQIENDYEIVVTIKGKPSFLLNQLELETVRKEKQRDEMPELELPQQSAPVDVVDSSVTTTEVPEGEAVTEAAAKKRRKRKRKKKNTDRPADAATEQADDVLNTSVPDEPVAPNGEDVIAEQSAEPLEPAAKKRRRSRSRRKPAVVKESEAEFGNQADADAGSPQVPAPVDVSDGDAPELPVKATRPKRPAKKEATAVAETIIGEDQHVPPADPVVVKPASRARKSSARKKTAQEPSENVGEPVEPVVAPKARKRPASRSKKSASVAVDEGKE
ncbi:RNAse E [Trichlorobacter thiogenes]|uniref:Ribonuclease G n=1 Tax=Trichlorobacter thiogenes TaxID=115783 RepID=A0A1T4R3Q2_9BACT|nr:Rne/Rng family ribonuclease [Trichlorobacter thiogenes]SKA10599.1 RNAse E [Trichlorobacter thiogenes]